MDTAVKPQNHDRENAVFCLMISLDSAGILPTLTQEERSTIRRKPFTEWPQALQEKLRPYGAEMVRDSPPQT